MNFRQLECFRKTRTMESVSACIRHAAGVGLVDPLTAQRHGDAEIVFSRFEPAVTFKVALVLPRDRLRSGILEEFLRILEFGFVGVELDHRRGKAYRQPAILETCDRLSWSGGTRAAGPVASGRGGRQPGYTN